MSDPDLESIVNITPQDRIRELEQENARLCAELERRQQQEYIGRHRETLYRKLAENLPNGSVFVVDHDLRYLIAGGQVLEEFGISPDRYEGKTLGEVTDAETAAHYEPLFRKALAGEAFITEHRGRGRDFVTHGTPVYDEEGHVIAALAFSYDITDRKLLQDSLLESESKFRNAFEHAAIGYALTAPDGRFVDVNDAYCRLTGYSAEELRELHFFDVVHPDDRDANLVLIEQVLAKEIPSFVIENRYMRKDGQPVWVRKSVSVVLGSDGKVKAILAVVEDISQIKQAEQALRASERLYRAIGETIPYGIWICDPQGRNIYASQSYLDLVGITQAQCSEFGWGDSLHPDDAERTIAAWKECVRVEGVWDIEHRFRGTDGQYHPILARGVPVRDDSGKIICWAGINLDIGPQKQAQEELRLSEQRFRTALQNSAVVVYTTDRDLRYTWLYDPTPRFPVDQVIGKTDEELRDPQEVAELIAVKRSVLETGIGKRQEIQMPDGDIVRSYNLMVDPLQDEAGHITGLTVAAVDITESKLHEQQIQESQMRLELHRRLLEQREQERLALARDLHDGPMQSLAAAVMDLDMMCANASDAALRDELAHLEQHLRDVGKELRDTVSELRHSLLRSMGLTRTIRAHARDFHKKHPELELAARLAADRGRLSTYPSLGLFRIYQEALNNAVQHARASKVSVSLSFTNDSAVLEIRDNGRGMEHFPDLLEQTAQGHYGLAGMKERAEAINAEFRLRSAPGKGTTILVKVPVNKHAEETNRDG